MNWLSSAIVTLIVWMAIIGFTVAHPVLGGLFILGAVVVSAR